ncbi:hypothetical protein DV735_g4065, partial [Chaetothyriales sp. CBS 134920]
MPELAARVGRACIYHRRAFTAAGPGFCLAYRPFISTARRPEQGNSDSQQGRSDSRQGRSDPRQGRSDPRQGRSDPRQGRSDPQQGKHNSQQAAWQAWCNTKIEWRPIPIGLGVVFLGLFQLWRIQRREEADNTADRPPPRPRIYPDGGGWQVSVMSTLPLKAISRLWGRFNELTIPYALRVPGFHLYGWLFGVNFDEIAEPDLHVFPNLASFFYRELKPGVRPIDPTANALVSPADAQVINFGTVANGQVEQVKGMTYELDALLGRASSPSRGHSAADAHKSADATHADQEFARINGISYTLPELLSGPEQPPMAPARDASTAASPASEAQVSAELARPWWSPFSATSPTQLFYIVVYLAPGDYHRFHSPASWVATSRRHFAGELYSVSPYVQRLLPGLFTINERVVLLGRWKYGFFSFIPVGATNVGSIKINFDPELRTNSLTTDTEADRQAELARQRGEPYSGFSEASYASASPLLHGYALPRGQEIGGFQLGSSVVLVFEAPASWTWTVERGQSVKVGQRIEAK